MLSLSSPHAATRTLDAPPDREALMARGRSFSVEHATDIYARLLLGETAQAAP